MSLAQFNILLIRDHSDGRDLVADYFADPEGRSRFEFIILVAARIAAAGNKQGITRIVLIHDRKSPAAFVTMDNITNVGFTNEFRKDVQE